MKIIVAAAAYNERKYIPFMVDYWQKQGCDLLIADNYSTDGTYEWLVENGIPVIRVDTKESFHLEKLQEALNNELKNMEADWMVYTGIDICFFFAGFIQDEIQKAEALGKNIISTTLFSIFNTGEDFRLPFIDNFFFGKEEKQYSMIARFHQENKIKADTILIENPDPYISDGFFVNYGMCKPKTEREETYHRRIMAWELGLRKCYGTHYKKAHELKWIWDRDQLTDIREIAERISMMKKYMTT